MIGFKRQQENLRRRYRPARLRLLLIGESPPASGRFFYPKDSGLYRAARDVFRVVYASITDDNFLEAFREAGCYLIDLCADPVDKMSPKERRAKCVASEAWLARRIVTLQPEAIATVVRTIEDNVQRAITRAGWSGPVLRLPYPGRWARNRTLFVEALSEWIISSNV